MVFIKKENDKNKVKSFGMDENLSRKNPGLTNEVDETKNHACKE